jgi:hypothetical protein
MRTGMPLFAAASISRMGAKPLPLFGVVQVLLGRRLFAQLSECSVTKFLLRARSELVRLA